nr:hypothetical protein [Streptomyces malaysiensis]
MGRADGREGVGQHPFGVDRHGYESDAECVGEHLDRWIAQLLDSQNTAAADEAGHEHHERALGAVGDDHPLKVRWLRKAPGDEPCRGGLVPFGAPVLMGADQVHRSALGQDRADGAVQDRIEDIGHLGRQGSRHERR